MDPLWLVLIGVVTVVGCITVLRLHAFIALILAALIVGTLTPRSALERFTESQKARQQMTDKMADDFLKQSVGGRVAARFGATCAGIGILIALASIIGKFLLDSGAADRIVRSIMRLVGEPRAPVAFAGSSFLLGIPVFFDTVFYLLMPLGKALRLRTGKNYLLYVMTIIMGGTMSHSLVPPTPGPLFAATQLGVDIGYMMLGGILVGLVTVSAGYLYALWLNRRMDVPLRDTPDVTLAELEKITQRQDRDLPPLWLALLPILLPVVLIGGHSVFNLLVTEVFAESLNPVWAARFAEWMKVTGFLGDTNIALMLATGAAFALVLRTRPPDAKPLGKTMEEALAGGGLIILITAAGGAFGGMLQQTGVGFRIQELATAYQIGILPLAWFVTALVRTAQGSATVAMFTAVGILGGMVASAELAFHPVYVALAIGCGSKPFPWMNDSGFWLITRMSGMTVSETIRSFSVMQVVMSVTGLATVLLLAKFVPLVGP